ncbi:MAG TPA: hypothetical protein VGN72_07905 [Tepidisphaeraceae bacterium]|jgi:hypothetical protein|nr:hypothetical protein [Tepidisphaeraceae bacterium]
MSLLIAMMLAVLLIGCQSNAGNAAMPELQENVGDGQVQVRGLSAGTKSTTLRAIAPASPTEPVDRRLLSITLVMTLPTSSTDASRTAVVPLGAGMAGRVYRAGNIEMQFKDDRGTMRTVRSTAAIELRNDGPNVLDVIRFEPADR